MIGVNPYPNDYYYSCRKEFLHIEKCCNDCKKSPLYPLPVKYEEPGLLIDTKKCVKQNISKCCEGKANVLFVNMKIVRLFLLFCFFFFW